MENTRETKHSSNSAGSIMASEFIRRIDLEPFLTAIKDNPILQINSSVNSKGIEQLEYDKSLFSPQSLTFFKNKGFYPLCYDFHHNKLVLAINSSYEFPDFDQPVTEENILLYLEGYFGYMRPSIFDIMPSTFNDIVKNCHDIEVKIVDAIIFDDIFYYVLDPRRVKDYENKRRFADSKDSGILMDGEESIAGEMLDKILTYAVNHRATDVHFEYTGTKYIARIRVDGDLEDYPKQIDSRYYAALINVIRNRSDLDIAEHFKAQDGKMQFDCHFVEKGKMSSSYDIRISIIPEVEGRLNAALRIQQKGEFKTINQLGFTEKVYSSVKILCKEPHGLILVTGPTGSGKTTTNYSILNELNQPDVKILSVEDPCEIKMEGITQVSVNEKQGRTFSNMLRHFLRHDPDIILVGEIRDAETAEIAINAANTGHLVLSTLHTNDAITAIKRLGNMEGIDPADFAFALKGILAQRLLKTFKKDITNGLCNGASKEFLIKNKLTMVDIGLDINNKMEDTLYPVETFYGYNGDNEAFEGRTAITEFWRVGNKAQDLIFDKNFSTQLLTKIALEEDHMLPMCLTGFEKVIKFVTSLDNLIKTVGLETLRVHKNLLTTYRF